MKLIIKKIVFALLFICISVTTANATPYLSLDPRSIGMGGTGVAIANSSQAHYYNPSLLVSAPEYEDFNIVLDVSARGTDPDSLSKNLNEFAEEEYFQAFVNDFVKMSNVIQAAATDGILSPTEFNALIAERDILVNSATSLHQGIRDITNRSLVGDVNGGLAMSSPGNEYGWAVFINSYLPIDARGNLDPEDDVIMENIIDALDAELNQDDLTQSLQAANTIRQVLIEEDPEERLSSDVSVHGAVIREFGFSYASKSTLNTYAFDFGITPKIWLVETFDERRSLNAIENEQNIKKSGQTESYTSFNFDIGVSKQLTANWKTGLAIKNVLPQTFKTPSCKSDSQLLKINCTKIKMEPAARIGVAYLNRWINFAADLDLTENLNSAGSGKSRYLAMGVEFDLAVVKLQTGYRVNLSNDFGYPSLGIGFHLLGINIEAAVGSRIPDIKDGDDVFDVISGLREVHGAARFGIKW